MAKTTVPKPEVGGDLVRVHRAITRALGVAQEHAEAHVATGHPDADTWKGYLTYVRCLTTLLHAHHTTEDEAMFPHLRDKLPHAPYDALMAQHHAIVPVLYEIEAAVSEAASPKPGQALSALGPTLARISEMWRTHIELEEAHFGPDAIGDALTMEERRRAGRVASNHAARHQRRLALMLPFLLYNMTPEDRAVMSQLMPPVVPLLLWMWKPRWKGMAPFLLVDV
jgi:hemerythrin-like domain-containing protein